MRNSCFCVIPENQALHESESLFSTKSKNTYIFHWLELITKVLSFLEVFSVRKKPLGFFNILETLPEYQPKKLYFWHILGL